MKYCPVTRRMFLQGMGGYLLSIPFLESLAPLAHAQTAPKTRFAMVLGALGRDYSNWYPKVTDNQMQSIQSVLVKPFSEIPGDLSYVFGSNWTSLRSKFSLVRGLDSMNCQGMHNNSLPTTGCSIPPSTAEGFGYSIDCILEESKKFYPTMSMIGALRTAPNEASNWSEFASFSFTSKAKLGQSIWPEWNPQEVYNKLLNPANVQLQASKNTRIRGATSLVLQSFNSTMNSRRIAAADKLRLDNYLSLINDLDNQLAVPLRTCNQTTDPGNDLSNWANIHKNMFKMEVAALACGVTSIVMHTMTQASDNAQGSAAWHDHAHGGDAMLKPNSTISYLAEHNKWSMDLVAYFLSLMNGITESNGGTLLDNTLFIYNNEDGSGNHDHYDLPVLTAGGGGKLRNGYLIDYRPRPLVPFFPGRPIQNIFAGRPYNNMLVTAFKALGLSESDYQKFGLQGFGRYDNYRPDLANHYLPFLGAKVNEPLPFLYTG